MDHAKPLAREEGLDHTLALLKEGYRFGQNRADAFQSDAFETRLLGEKALVLRGEEAARFFYDSGKLVRSGAMPKRVQKTLTGEQGVQGLDGAEHRHRKAMFMSLMHRGALREMRDIVAREWMLAAGRWEGRDDIELYEEAKLLLARAACAWAGVPLESEDAPRLAESLGAMYEAPASLGLAYVKGRRSRRQGEKRFAALIEDVREGRLEVPEGTALRTIALHRDLQGGLLPAKIAAVELLNILRPIVAVAVYVAFTAHAVIHHPEEASRLARNDGDPLGRADGLGGADGPDRGDGSGRADGPDRGDGSGRADGPVRGDGSRHADGPDRGDGSGRADAPVRGDGSRHADGPVRIDEDHGERGAEWRTGKREELLQRFVQEVRRFYPFFPVAAARAGEPAEWAGFRLEAGHLVLLDLYATNRHPALWSDPESFQPERFADWQGSPFKFVPQGGGGHDAGHRCAGEWITLEIMKESLDFLASRLSYELPEQDLSFSLSEIPSLPHSRIRLRNLRLRR